MKTKIHITVESTTIHLLNRLQKENDISLGRAVDILARKELDRNEEEMLAEIVAAKVVERLKGQ